MTVSPSAANVVTEQLTAAGLPASRLLWLSNNVTLTYSV